MDQYSIQLKGRVMRKVYGIWFMRNVLPALVLELGLFVVVLAGAQSYMSVSAVWENATIRATAYPLAAFGRFWLEALFNSELALKFLLAAAAVLGVILMRDSVRISKRLRGNLLRFSRVS